LVRGEKTMSRIGNKIIKIPQGVEVNIDNNKVVVKGPHGTLEREFSTDVYFELENEELKVRLQNNNQERKQIHGTVRALLANMIEGVHTRFKIELEIVGTGYRAQLQGNELTVNAGYANPVVVTIPENIEVTVPKNTQIIIEGLDKQVVGEFAANIRKIRRPEPYKGKGIKYKDEVIRRKEGKIAKV